MNRNIMEIFSRKYVFISGCNYDFIRDLLYVSLKLCFIICDFLQSVQKKYAIKFYSFEISIIVTP